MSTGDTPSGWTGTTATVNSGTQATKLTCSLSSLTPDTQYYYAIEHPDRLRMQILPYAIGAVSWASAIIILFGSGLWRRIGKDPGDTD